MILEIIIWKVEISAIFFSVEKVTKRIHEHNMINAKNILVYLKMR